MGLLPSTCSWVFLAVKPQEMKSVMDRLRCSPGSAVTTRIWISVAAGISSSTLLKMLSDGQLGRQLIRAMPNTAVLLKCGCVTYSTDIQDDSITRSFETLMKPLGLCVRVPEGQMNATCALSGSGIAFLLMALEALSDGGVKMGLPRALSSQLAAQTMMGAAQLALTAVEPPAILRERVSSPGGTTMAGLHALEKGAFRSVLIDAVEAATRKGEELSSSSLVNSNS
ncbi:unnamed protein product [Darwinula stevensoni]|uniref:Pyrroline-5-carboxylate reductase n=1 Tax=Darwinula stevensoni TaxID=69355 RepID=A0A7R8X2R3_9CRUS|nr:unnamed protein product [Darwinula stevensoni]CAG0884214.1 unnamed protein product [Darwinula stevensoni]